MPIVLSDSGSRWVIAIASPTLSPTLHISRAVTDMPEDQLAGILAHELGHLYEPRLRRRGLLAVSARVALVPTALVPLLWPVTGAALGSCMWQRRSRQLTEYFADGFAADLGFGPGLRDWLGSYAHAHEISLDERSEPHHSHPSPGERVAFLDAVLRS